MQNSIVAIGLDDANPGVLHQWTNLGHLSNLTGLRNKGVLGKLRSAINHTSAKTPWSYSLTGSLTEKKSHRTAVKYHADKYRCDNSKLDSAGGAHAHVVTRFPESAIKRSTTYKHTKEHLEIYSNKGRNELSETYLTQESIWNIYELN